MRPHHLSDVVEVLSVLLLFCSFHGTNSQNIHGITTRWTYENQSLWHLTFENCGGRSQSPLSIETDLAEPLCLSPLIFSWTYWKRPRTSTIVNNGHTALVTVSGCHPAYLWGGPLPHFQSFIFEQFHFHWGAKDSAGSEHTIDGKRFPLELHLVHYNSRYGSFNQSRGRQDGLAVLTVLYELLVSDRGRDVLTPIVNALRQIKPLGSSTQVQSPGPLIDLLPRDKSAYFHYDGSLTTPPCSENVHWIIFKSRNKVTHEQLEAFRDLTEVDSRPLWNNFRQLQAINGRTVFLADSKCPWFLGNHLDSNDVNDV